MIFTASVHLGILACEGVAPGYYMNPLRGFAGSATGAMPVPHAVGLPSPNLKARNLEAVSMIRRIPITDRRPGGIACSTEALVPAFDRQVVQA